MSELRVALDDLSIAPDFTCDIRKAGNEHTPVIVIDDILSGVQGLIDCACADEGFCAEQQSLYPGIKAPLPAALSEVILPVVVPMLYRLHRIPAFLRPRSNDEVFSLVTAPPESLHMLQRIPHYDSNKPFFFALLLYLSDKDFGGTGFFRHRPTGFERITPERLGTYIRAAEQYMEEFGQPPLQYINGSNDHYELIEPIDHRANRLVVYPGNLLHSGLIDPARDLDSNPRTGRLTANIFVEFV